MNFNILKEWLRRLDTIVGQKIGRSVLLLLDNASCHGQRNDLLFSKHVRVLFLPNCTTSILQPLDLGIIACIKKRYEHRVIKNAVDLIEIGVTEQIYQIDLKEAIMWIYEIWYRTPNRIIYNCWIKSRLVEP